jgi:hypothetical protein
MKAFKGFNQDMTCRGFQYEEGKEYATDKADLCETGFHACEYPLDCFGYYAPSESVYHEVELEEVTDQTEDDTKRVGKRIKIGAALSVKGIVDASVKFIFDRVDRKNQKEANITPNVVQLGNSGTEYTLEELALHTKSITRLTMNFGINNCKLCKIKDRSDWQVTEFDDTWGFLCGPCGIKLSKKLNKYE